MATFKLTIIGPRGKVFDQAAESIVVPGELGQLGILAHHTPMIALLQLGLSKVAADGQEIYFATGQGVVEVERNEVNVLVDMAEKADSAQAGQHRVQAEREARAKTSAQAPKPAATGATHS